MASDRVRRAELRWFLARGSELLSLAFILSSSTPVFGQPLAQANPETGKLVAGGCEIKLPPGAQAATFQATLWSARLVPGGPIILGVVPFEFDANVNSTNQARTLASMAEIMSFSDVQFIPRNTSLAVHPNWLHIQDSPTNNNSFLGMIGGGQVVNITSWAQNQPNVNFVIVHELFHALGFWHEHQRTNRDTYIRVNDGAPPPEPNCIDPAFANQYTINATAQMIGVYDLDSVMHYPSWAFAPAWPSCPSFDVLASPGPPLPNPGTPGQRNHLSQPDIDGLCTMYGCAPVNNDCVNAITVTNGETIINNRWATNSTAGGCAALQRDAWYVYDATCLGEVTMSLINPSAGYTPALAVYEDPCGGGPLVSCDTTAPLTATFPVAPGERFRIRVGGTGSTMGTARLYIACAPINCTTGLQWAQVATSGPGARYDHAMAYDSHRQEVVLHGGILSGVANSATWEWSSASQSWTQVVTIGPGARFNHAMVYDSVRQRVVLFGGHNGTSFLGDTWEYDPASNTWLDRTPVTSPIARSEHAMAYDSARQRAVLFGGVSGIAHNDTWEWNGTAGTWSQITPVGVTPAARYGSAMAYDTARQRTVMWGGYNFSGLIPDANVHEWNGTSWTQPGSLSPVRGGHTLVFDSASDEVLLFSGTNGTTFPNDLWSWNGTAWNNLGNASAPVGRHNHAAAFDQSAAAMIVQGGSANTGLQSDTWRALVGVFNEDAAGALLVGNGTTSFDNRCASNGSGSCAELRDLWYRYNAGVSGTLTASVTGANFAAEVAIYNAASPGGAPLACGTGSTPVAKTLMLPGSYLIRVGSATAIGGVGNLDVNGAAENCPPTFNVSNPNTYKQRLFEVIGTSNGLPWAWKITRGSDVMFDLDVPGIPPGASANALSAAFVASINAHSCPDNRLWAVQINSPYQRKFRVLVGGSTSFSFCIGPAGQNPTCCVTSSNWCPFNPDLREIMLSETDCNKNFEDDTIDLLVGDGFDVNLNGVLDECEPGCPADVDGSGDVGFNDLTQVLIHWGPCDELCPWDIDGSGDVGFGDLTQVLLGWGACEAPDAPGEG